ncbi:hypothetical protein [Nannocystis punicea]|uniref:Lipoprotein n=1 Tax=Nannocystis punicea TaxID=2995304 RepID=A0ABY7H8U1_9BACT|nr:hypothetical protein [Nannocystis poenicansa]WAS95681.1 hypothetical protein O0S08_05920 [Nannocystis poenicansa]
MADTCTLFVSRRIVTQVRRLVLAFAALVSACATAAAPQARPPEPRMGYLAIEVSPAENAPSDGYCWSSTARSAAGGEPVFAEDGCVRSGGVSRGGWLEPGEYTVELVHCAGADCNAERDPSRYPLACPPIRVTIVAGRLAKVRERWSVPDDCAAGVHEAPL